MPWILFGRVFDPGSEIYKGLTGLRQRVEGPRVDRDDGPREGRMAGGELQTDNTS